MVREPLYGFIYVLFCLQPSKKRNIFCVILFWTSLWEVYKVIKSICYFWRILGREWWGAKYRSVQFIRSLMSDSLWPHELQHARPLCPSTNPRACSKSVHWVGDAIQQSHLLSSPLLPSIFPSIRVFSSESVLHIRWPKNWSFSFSINPSNEYSGLISFRIDWFDFLAVQGTLKSLLQHHISKASILWHSAFFMAQVNHL